IRPDRPYLIAGGDVTPRIDMLRPWYHKFNNPNLNRWAVISQNDPIGHSCQAWEVGSALAEGWDVVFDKHYEMETTDFASIVSEMLATKPDVVSLNLSYPDFVALIMEQLFFQGYKGIVSGNYMDTETLLEKVPVTFLEGATDSFPLFDDPWWGELSFQHDFFNKWQKRYGPGTA
ncbi:MAG: ABC transporter substrate-binding protein, partial [bacterium]|nr:ABC transporter substrate-binding protein [bacterium]